MNSAPCDRTEKIVWPSKAKDLFRTLVIFVLLLIASRAHASSTIYDQALSLLQKRDFSTATTLLRDHLRKNPQDDTALNLMGIALAEQGRDEEAAASFGRALQVNPTSPSTLRNLGLLEWKLGNRDAALQSFNQLLDVAPDDELAHAHLGIQAFESNDFRIAVNHWRKATSILKQEPRLRLNLAGAFSQLGDDKAADAEIEQLRRQTADAKLLFQAATMLAQFGRPKAAIDIFLSLRDSFPDKSMLSYNLALAYLGGNQPDRAVETLEHALSSGGIDSDIFRLLAHIHERSGNLGTARAILDKALKTVPSNEGLYLDLSTLLVHSDQDVYGAIRVIRDGIQKIPESAALHTQLGILSFMRGLTEQAEEEFETAARLDPDIDFPLIGVSASLMRLGKVDEAIEILRKRLLSDPDNPEILLMLGTSLSKKGFLPGSREAEEALRVLEKSVKLNPQSAKSHVGLAKAYAKLDRDSDAIREYERALEIDPNEVTACYQLGLIHKRNGNEGAAQAYMTEAAELNRAKSLHPQMLQVFRLEAERRK